MDRVMQEAIRGFEMYYPELTGDVVDYREDRIGYLIVDLKDGRTLIYDDVTTQLQELSVIDFDIDFGKRLRRVMNRKAVSQKELAERLGISEPTISRYINGRSLPNIKIASTIAKILNCSVEDFYYIDHKKKE